MATARSPVQMFALVFGAIYVLVGLLGFVNDPILDTFDVNSLHNVVHLAIGGALVFSSRDHATAKTVSLVVGVAYLLVALLGFVAKDFMDDLLKINTADNFLHLGSGAVALYFGTAGAEMSRPTTV
jgi:RsiW-degrading membrane proteinase PrsW (M82 family)